MGVSDKPERYTKADGARYLAILSDKAQGVYNLASHNLVSNKELAELCIKLTDSKSKVVYSGTPDAADGLEWDVCLDKIHADTGYVPKVGIEEMILEMKEYFTENPIG